MATIHREGNLDLLSGKVAVLGYGSQGHAHALNPVSYTHLTLPTTPYV